MALYLKYRPQNFADVVGQDHVVTTLEQAVTREQISHAYLLSGTRGTGKTSVARILAKTILLRGVKDEKIAAQITKAVEDGSFVDLIEIDAASNRRIDDIRDLIEKVGFSPAVSTAKVYIVDEVHMLTKEAFNALLKTLEEPPPYAFFILATTELHKVPDTIQSRCQRFLFKRVKDDDLIRRLQFISDQEHIDIDRDALRAIARHAAGSFRDGISLLDQLHSLEKIRMKDVAERVGNSVGTFVDDLIGAISIKDAALISSTVEKIEEAGVPLDIIASELLGHVREEMHAAIDRKENIDPYVAMIDSLLTGLRYIRLSPVPGIALESALLSFCTNPAPIKEQAKEKTAPTLSPRTVEPTAVAVADVPDTKAAAPAPKRQAGLIEAEDFTVPNVFKHWEHILKNVTPPSAKMSLKNAAITSIDGLTLNLSFPSAFHRDKVADIKASRSIEDVLQTVFNQPIRIKCTLEKDSKPTVVRTDTDLVEAAAEVFGGF